MIRGLDLHKHYERLLPSGIFRPTNETFVPIPYFNDFLVVHPYNIKNGTKQVSYTEAKKQLYANFVPTMQQLPEVDPIKINTEVFPNSANAYPIRRATRTNSWRSSNLTEAKINDFDLNHIFLLNKCKLIFN